MSFNKKHSSSGKKKSSVNQRFSKRNQKSQTTKVSDKKGIRLNKYIANAGICSRREADMYIKSGNVAVNEKIVTQMGYQVQPNDVVKFDGSRISPEKNRYLLLNKPKNFLTTTNDQRGRKTVMDLVVNATKERLYPVGRLDRNTTGLLLFTNDGELAKKLTNPKKNVHKIYQASLNKKLSMSDLKKIEEGVVLDGRKVIVDEVSYIKDQPKTEIGIKIHSGRNRIVHRIFEHLNYEVAKLDRVIFANLTKKNLPRGHWRFLTDLEVNSLKML